MHEWQEINKGFIIMLIGIWQKVMKIMHGADAEVAVTIPAAGPEPVNHTDEISNEQKAASDAANRQIKQLLAGIIGVSEDQITPEFVKADLKAKRQKELEEARAAGKIIFTAEQVEQLAQDFDARLAGLAEPK